MPGAAWAFWGERVVTRSITNNTGTKTAQAIKGKRRVFIDEAPLGTFDKNQQTILRGTVLQAFHFVERRWLAFLI